MNYVNNIFLSLLFISSLHAVNTDIVSQNFVGQDADRVYLEKYINANKDVERNVDRAAAKTVACNGRMKAGKALLERGLVVGDAQALVRAALKNDAQTVATHYHDKSEAKQILGEIKRGVL